MASKPKLVPKTPQVLESIDDLRQLIGNSRERVHGFFSPRLAKELIINQPAEYQRRVDRGYVALYRRAMAAEPCQWRHYQQDNLMIFDEDCQMMLGHHRCLASVEGRAIFGAWIIGNEPGGEAKYYDQIRARAPGQTVEMFGHHNASNIASVAKMFLFWTIGESPLARGRISPDEANNVLETYPEIQDWYAQARRIKSNHLNSTPSVPWLTYILGQMHIAGKDLGQEFTDALEYLHDGRMRTEMARVLHATWNGRPARNSVAMKVWYHNTAARAWDSFVTGEPRTKLVAPKDQLLGWTSPKPGAV